MDVNNGHEVVNEPNPEAVSAQPAAEPVAPPTLPPGLRLLIGHESQETAYLQDDYPYGRDRCKRKLWIETKAKHGQRFMAQTQNPKNGRWNTPKASTYGEIYVMVLDERPDSDTYNHVLLHGIGMHATEEKLDAFIATHGPALQSKYHKDKLNLIRALARANTKVTWSIVPSESNPSGSFANSAAALTRQVGRELAIIEGQG
ncbi:hypothetical protein EKK58_05555 [Candidatus Dependentiae bacterium]|nr:MAG: hypothetical protein EKK58_05555 [Candidatus Dependentiae bacterium]